MAVGGHLPEIQVPPIGGLFGPESLPRWMGGIDDSRRAAQTSVLESAHYVCEVAPQRVQILLQIVQHLMTQLLRDARGRSDDDRCTRQLASVVIVASAVTTRMRISGREADQAAIGLGLGTTVVLARVQARLAARTAPVAGSASAAPPNRPTPQTMVGHSAADSRIIFSDLGTAHSLYPRRLLRVERPCRTDRGWPCHPHRRSGHGFPRHAVLHRRRTRRTPREVGGRRGGELLRTRRPAHRHAHHVAVARSRRLPRPGPRSPARRRRRRWGPCGRGVRDRRLAGSAGIGTRLEGV